MFRRTLQISFAVAVLGASVHGSGAADDTELFQITPRRLQDELTPLAGDELPYGPLRGADPINEPCYTHSGMCEGCALPSLTLS